MLKEINYVDAKESLFICDRCKKIIKWENKNSIHVGEHNGSPIKKWDLCDRCYTMLKHGIMKGAISSK